MKQENNDSLNLVTTICINVIFRMSKKMEICRGYSSYLKTLLSKLNSLFDLSLKVSTIPYKHLLGGISS